MREKCRGCSASVRGEAGDIEEGLAEEQRVSEHAFRKRLETCGTCGFLDYGTTCRHSGALVQYRARLRDSSCPDPSGARW